MVRLGYGESAASARISSVKGFALGAPEISFSRYANFGANGSEFFGRSVMADLLPDEKCVNFVFSPDTAGPCPKLCCSTRSTSRRSPGAKCGRMHCTYFFTASKAPYSESSGSTRPLEPTTDFERAIKPLPLIGGDGQARIGLKQSFRRRPRFQAR